MNYSAFAVIVAQERELGSSDVGGVGGDDISALAGLGARNPLLAWPITISMLALAGIPGTVGFIGKFQLIHALVDGNYTWLAIVLVIGSMISLGYYLRVIAAVWMRAPAVQPLAAGAGAGSGLAPIAGGSPEADAPAETVDPFAIRAIMLVAVLFSAAVIFFGVFPQPLFDLASHAAQGFGTLL
jgi:NADH-quinone oxidoreductase subunit N